MITPTHLKHTHARCSQALEKTKYKHVFFDLKFILVSHYGNNLLGKSGVCVDFMMHALSKTKKKTATQCFSRSQQTHLSNILLRLELLSQWRWMEALIPDQKKHSTASCTDKPNLKLTPWAALCCQQVPLDGACMLPIPEQSAAHGMLDWGSWRICHYRHICRLLTICRQ